MKKHQIVAIVVGLILSLVSFLPVFLMIDKGYNLVGRGNTGVFLFPTIGVSMAAILIVIAFLKD